MPDEAALPVGRLLRALVRLFLVSENTQLVPPLGSSWRVLVERCGAVKPGGRTVSLPAILTGSKQSVVSQPMVCKPPTVQFSCPTFPSGNRIVYTAERDKTGSTCSGDKG